jgi:hypothetical protein
MDPMLTDPENGDFSILAGSPCIDAGDPDFPIDPDTTIADIGALYFDQTSVQVLNHTVSNSDIKLYHYPNPVSGFVTFVIEGNDLLDVPHAKIKIYDVSGHLIDEIGCPFLNKGFGKKIYRYDISSTKVVKQSMLIYTLESDDQILSTNKMILVR